MEEQNIEKSEKELKKDTYREIKRKTLIYNNLAEFASTLP
jgi:hypothetical protein